MSTNRNRGRKLSNRIDRKAFPVPGIYRGTHAYSQSKGKTRAILKQHLRREIAEVTD